MTRRGGREEQEKFIHGGGKPPIQRYNLFARSSTYHPNEYINFRQGSTYLTTFPVFDLGYSSWPETSFSSQQRNRMQSGWGKSQKKLPTSSFMSGLTTRTWASSSCSEMTIKKKSVTREAAQENREARRKKSFVFAYYSTPPGERRKRRRKTNRAVMSYNLMRMFSFLGTWGERGDNLEWRHWDSQEVIALKVTQE